MNTIGHCFLFMFIVIVLKSQNNGIFYGGYGDGHASAIHFSELNNNTFNGGGGDGYSSDMFQSDPNNGIFQGEIGDGYDVNNYIQSLSNLIFEGDRGDGYSSNQIESTINNYIYAGGYGHGHDQDFINVDLNNSIFTGNTGDGFDSKKVLNEVNNNIYAGGNSDGYDQSNINKILWEGITSSEWNLASNWNLNRVPVLEDYIEVRNGKLNYPILDQISFKINEAGIYNYACSSLLIHDLATITTGKNVHIINVGSIVIYGSWHAMNTDINAFTNKGTGSILVESGGTFEIKN